MATSPDLDARITDAKELQSLIEILEKENMDSVIKTLAGESSRKKYKQVQILILQSLGIEDVEQIKALIESNKIFEEGVLALLQQENIENARPIDDKEAEQDYKLIREFTLNQLLDIAIELKNLEEKEAHEINDKYTARLQSTFNHRLLNLVKGLAIAVCTVGLVYAIFSTAVLPAASVIMTSGFNVLAVEELAIAAAGMAVIPGFSVLGFHLADLRECVKQLSRCMNSAAENMDWSLVASMHEEIGSINRIKDAIVERDNHQSLDEPKESIGNKRGILFSKKEEDVKGDYEGETVHKVHHKISRKPPA